MGLIEYVTLFQAQATKLASDEFAAQWFLSGVPVEDAIAWADLDFTPGEARDHMDNDVTLKMLLQGR